MKRNTVGFKSHKNENGNVCCASLTEPCVSGSRFTQLHLRLELLLLHESISVPIVQSQVCYQFFLLPVP